MLLRRVLFIGRVVGWAGALAACGAFEASESAPADAAPDAAGDARLNPDSEQRGDGAAPDAPAAPKTCPGIEACTRVVFVTSAIFTFGAGANPTFSDLETADLRCNEAAARAIMNKNVAGATFVAWLSVDAKSAGSRMVHGTKPYVGATGLPIAANWTALTSGMLERTIDLDEYGAQQKTNTTAWTGTATDGRATVGTTCANWKGGVGSNGTIGSLARSDNAWTNQGPYSCGGYAHLYCIEQ